MSYITRNNSTVQEADTTSKLNACPYPLFLGNLAVVIIIAFSMLGCTHAKSHDMCRHSFVMEKQLLSDWAWDHPEHWATQEQVAIALEFMHSLSQQYPSEVYLLEGCYSKNGSVFAVFTSKHEDDLYYLLEVSGMGQTFRYTTIPMS
ncbi:hypothetical protein HED60_16795 [Planctomycetales bacterium ZRK34]|nr:hypothetical protein HED60_16795 [Planctomycetales bacterium ZRK34]